MLRYTEWWSRSASNDAIVKQDKPQLLNERDNSITSRTADNLDKRRLLRVNLNLLPFSLRILHSRFPSRVSLLKKAIFRHVDLRREYAAGRELRHPLKTPSARLTYLTI